MKVDEVNKGNILNIDSNSNLAKESRRKWIDSYPELAFEVLITDINIKIYKESHSMYAELYIVTDIANNVLHWIHMYDYFGRYMTAYEHVFVGDVYNYHIDRKDGKLNQYARR